MYIKTIFLNGNLKEKVYMTSLESFCINKDSYLIYKLKKSIYEFK